MSIFIAQQAELESGYGEVAIREHVCIGEWEIQPELNRLQHRHSVLYRQLEPRLVHLLCYLVANADRVLTRNELIRELWPHVIVNENSLTRAISELRKHLAFDGSSERVYIETIPKKGYRLLPPVEPAQSSSNTLADLSPVFLPTLNWSQKAAISAICLTLVMATWFRLPSALEAITDDRSPTLIADEVMADELQWFGAKVILSTAETAEFDSASIESPVVSHSGNQYAYIRYDNGGSTIYLGDLEEMTEPVAVYSCHTHLYNLAWSPVGNSLLFARKAGMAIPALFSSDQEVADFLMLDLDSMTLRQLLEDNAPAESEPVKLINLT